MSKHILRETLAVRRNLNVNANSLKDQVVAIQRVTKVVKGGKNLSFSALVVVGDQAGHAGFGMGKAREGVRIMIHKAQSNPKRIVFPEGEHEKVLRAAHILVDEKFAKPILLGVEEVVRSKARDLGLELDDLLGDAESGRSVQPEGGCKSDDDCETLDFHSQYHFGCKSVVARPLEPIFPDAVILRKCGSCS